LDVSVVATVVLDGDVVADVRLDALVLLSLSISGGKVFLFAVHALITQRSRQRSRRRRRRRSRPRQWRSDHAHVKVKTVAPASNPSAGSKYCGYFFQGA
jgi:hypothetical protein